MKKTILSGLMAGLLTITPVFADTTIVEVAPGITPDSVFYVMDRWVEDIQLAFKGDPERKAELLHQVSLERLAEAEKMLEVNKKKQVKTAVEGYILKLELIQEIIGELLVSEDISDETKEALVNRLEALTEIRDETIAAIKPELKVELKEKIDNAYLVANSIKGLDREKVKALRTEKQLGYGQIAHVFRLADATDKSVEEVAELLSQGKGIGQLAEELNLHPSVLKGKNKKIVSENPGMVAREAAQEVAEEDKDEARETAPSEKIKNQEARKIESQRKEENPKVKEKKEEEKQKEVVKHEEKIKSESTSKDNKGKKKN